MKITKQIIIFSLLALFLSNLSSVTNKTFFMPRPIQQDAVMQNAMSLEFTNVMSLEYAKDPDINCGFILIGNLFYEQSTSKSDLAKYFSINNKTELTIAGNTSGITEKDIATEWLGISNWDSTTLEQNFSSKINLSPEQKEFGINFQAHKVLNFISNKLWLSITLPFIQKETDLKLNETNIQNEPTKQPIDVPKFMSQNASDFFNSEENLRYGKIKNGVQKLAGLADINLKLNYFFKNKKSWTLSFYPQLTIPTGYKPTAKYLFEPIIGNGRHWELGAGLNFEMELLDKNKHLLSFISKLDYNYSFESTEKRTLDLKEKPWSRYLRLTDQATHQINTVAVNLFTQDFKIQPESNLNLLLSLHYDHNDFLNLELGYNLWWKAKEGIKFKNEWVENVGITQLNADNNPTGNTISNATIATNPLGTGNTSFTTIELDNLDLNSAIHDSALSNKIYLSGGVEGTWKQNIYQTNLALAYEFASNKALSAWSLWLQANLYI